MNVVFFQHLPMMVIAQSEEIPLLESFFNANERICYFVHRPNLFMSTIVKGDSFLEIFQINNDLKT
jgi:DNA-directed RNA polymerase